MIRCFNLTVPHPGGQRPLLDQVSLDIDEGQWVEIIGPSGAGKTLLFSVLSLRRACPQGKLVLAGRNLARLDEDGLAEVRRELGSCAQSPALLDERTVVENLILPLVARGRQHEGVLETVEDLVADTVIEPLLDIPAGDLCRAEYKLVGVFRALVGTPKLVLVDGAFEGLADKTDQASQVLHRAWEAGATVVLTAREPLAHTAAWRTRILRLDDGQLDEDSSGDDQMLHGAA